MVGSSPSGWRTSSGMWRLRRRPGRRRISATASLTSRPSRRWRPQSCPRRGITPGPDGGLLRPRLVPIPCDAGADPQLGGPPSRDRDLAGVNKAVVSWLAGLNVACSMSSGPSIGTLGGVDRVRGPRRESSWSFPTVLCCSNSAACSRWCSQPGAAGLVGTAGRRGIVVASTVLSMLVIEGFVYAFLPTPKRPVLAASPSMLWLTRLSPVARLGPKTRAAVASGLILIPVASRVGPGPRVQIGQQWVIDPGIGSKIERNPTTTSKVCPTAWSRPRFRPIPARATSRNRGPEMIRNARGGVDRRSGRRRPRGRRGSVCGWPPDGRGPDPAGPR